MDYNDDDDDATQRHDIMTMIITNITVIIITFKISSTSNVKYCKLNTALNANSHV